MSGFGIMVIEILCRSDAKLSQKNLAEFIIEGVYFAEAPTFSQDILTYGEDSNDFRILEVHYKTGKKPVLIERYAADTNLFAEIVEEKKLIFESAKTASRNITDEIKNAAQVLCISFDEESVDDEVWLMLDCVEAFICRTLDGLIFTDDGVFDQSLQQIVEY